MYICVFYETWEVSSYCSSNILSASVSLPSSEVPFMWMLLCLMVSHRSHRLCSCFSFFYLSASQSRQFQLTCLQIHEFFLPPMQIFCWNTLMSFLGFLLQLLYFLAPKILFNSFLYFLSLYWNFLCVYIILLIPFNSLSTISFSMSIFKVVYFR